jgi:uncharacterized repeat protein (TIGR01451 family)
MSIHGNHAGKLLCLLLAATAAGFFAPASPARAATPAGPSLTNQASATYSDANSNSFSASSNTTTVTVTSVYSVAVTSPSDSAGGSNTVVYYPYTVTNNGNADATFTLTAATDPTLPNSWSVALYFDDDGDGVHDSGETTVTSSTGSLAPAGTYKCFVAVTIPVNTANAQTDGTVLSVTGTGSASAATASDEVVTTAQAPAVTIVKAVRNVTAGGSFGETATAIPTNVLEYRLTVANGGSATATAVVLTDADNAYTTYVAGSMYIGSNGTTYNGSGNTLQDDDASGGTACSADACGHANAAAGGPVTAYLGTGATETAGGAIATGGTVYVYFRVTVD